MGTSINWISQKLDNSIPKTKTTHEENTLNSQRLPKIIIQVDFENLQFILSSFLYGGLETMLE